MTSLDDVPAPLLIIAPDGWVALIRDRTSLARWNRRAIAKYNRIGFLVLDGEGAAWRLERLRWTRAGIAARLFGKPAETRVELVPAGEPALAAAKRALAGALDADDDVLTQFASDKAIRKAVKTAGSVPELIAALKRLRAID
jgi:hypothetical protein